MYPRSCRLRRTSGWRPLRGASAVSGDDADARLRSEVLGSLCFAAEAPGYPEVDRGGRRRHHAPDYSQAKFFQPGAASGQRCSDNSGEERSERSE
jgi:hypothetical protein